MRNFYSAIFLGLLQSVEGKKKEVQTLMERISQIEEMLAGQPPETHQEFWRVKLEELKKMSIQNQASDEEVNASKQFVELLFLTLQTKAHLEEVKKKHTGDSERELTKALKANQVDQNAFHNGMIVGNMCMKFGENGNAIINDLSKAMSNKIKDPENLTYLKDTKVALKNIIGLWFKLMKVMKSKRRQTDEEIEGFKLNTMALNKAIQQLISHPPVPGCKLKYSKQLKSHLLFDLEILDFLMIWANLGAIDDQSIEGVHPILNHLYRRFGNSRGAF